MSAYQCLKNDNDYNDFINELVNYQNNHSKENYYKVRDMDKLENFKNSSLSSHASRMVYLNKACFNGLYRVNSKGNFNVPFGQKEKVNTFDRDNMEKLHSYMKNNKIEVMNVDFEKVVVTAKPGDFIYFDPPYDIWEEKSSFTSYSKDSFGKPEQKRLANVFKNLADKGVYVMLSNHNTKFINELYKDFNISVVSAKRMINSKADGRGNVEEVIITNY